MKEDSNQENNNVSEDIKRKKIFLKIKLKIATTQTKPELDALSSKKKLLTK